MSARSLVSRTAVRTAAGLTAGLVSGALALGSPAPASAGGDHHGDGYRDVTIALTQGVTRALYAGDNWVSGLGSADVRRYDGRIILSLPVSGASYRGGTARLGGGIGFLGDGPDVAWKGFVVDKERGTISAVSNGSRITVLKITGRDGHHRGDDGGRAKLVLTTSGASSLNRAVDGSPFRTGTVFAGDSTGCR